MNKNFTRIQKKVIETVTDTIKNTGENLTKSSTESYFINNKAIENLNNKLLEIMNDRGILASYLMSPLSKITNRENTTQFRLVKNLNSNRVSYLLKNNTIPITLLDKLETFRDTCKVFELKGHLLKKITNKNYNVELAGLMDKKIL